MPRKNRFQVVSGFSTHHVVQRGINRSSVFQSHHDYAYFKDQIRRYLSKYDTVKIYHYCFMPNHIHLLCFTAKAPQLSRFMQSLLLAYSSYYRKKYRYSGYLWQGRFKAFPIQKDSYLLECARYIERNPLRTKRRMVERLSSYRWSSYNFYANGTQDDIITEDPLHKNLGATAEERRTCYQEYILIPRPYEQLIDDVFRI